MKTRAVSPPITRWEIFGFSLFDFANSSYTTVIISVLYSVYFVKTIGSPFLWSMTLSFSYLAVLLISPPAGAVADYRGRKKPWLLFSTLLCTVATGLLVFSGKERLGFTLSMIILSNIGFSLSEIFVSSFLPGLSTEGNIGRISGFAWAFGYLGGIGSLGVCLLYLEARGGGAFSHIPLITAGFFLLFALPCFFLLRERAPISRPPVRGYLRMGFLRLQQTFSEIRRFSELLKFLAAFFCFTCGTATVISFGAIFAEEVLHFQTPDIIRLFLVSNVASAVGAFSFGFVQDRIGAKRTLTLTLCIWLTAVFSAYFVTRQAAFWGVALSIGFAMGASQSASRSLVGLFSPAGKSAEFFSFWGFAGKSAAIGGLFSFGAFLRMFGGHMRSALLLTSAFFLSGLVILYFVNEPRGRAAARGIE